jgi:hypothetical protein
MSLDISRLENARKHSGKITARCPACAEAGHDQTRNHLIIADDGRFGCVVYPGQSPDAGAHRKRIFALCGNRETKPLVVRNGALGRLGRGNESHSEAAPLKAGVLGRLGRLFQTHLPTEPTREEKEGQGSENLNDCEKGVPAVPTKMTPNRALADGELLLLRRAIAENDPIIITALNLFNATIVE